MIIFLYGPDTYRSKQKLNEIISHYQKIHKSGLNLKYFDLKEKDFSEIENEISSVPMLFEKKLIILKNAFFNRKFEENFLKNPKFFLNLKDIILFYEAKEVNEKTPLFIFFKKNVKSQKFSLLEEQRLRNWIKKEFEKYKVDINESILDLLIDFVGNDLWQMENEIRKLVSFKSGKKIEAKDIQILVRPKIETDIFKTIDALSQKNKKKALFLIQKHLEKGDSPSYILAMINFQFRNLLIIKDLIEKGKFLKKILKEINLHPYLIKKTYFQAKRFKFDELKKIYQKIFEVDLKIKTGKIKPQAALEALVAEI